MFQPADVGQIPTTQFNLPKPKAKGGMFGGGGFGLKEAIAFGLAGFMARRNPMLLQGLMGSMMQKRQGEQDEQQYQRQRMDKRDDFLFEQAHRAPPNPHYFEDNSGNLMAIGPDGQPQMLYKDPNPFKLVPNGMGGVVPVNMEELMRNYKPAPPGVTFEPIEDGGPAAPPPGPFPLGFRP